MLSALARTQGGNKKAIVQAGGIAPLIALLSDPAIDTQKHAACALWGLAEGKEGIYDKQIVEAAPSRRSSPCFRDETRDARLRGGVPALPCAPTRRRSGHPRGGRARAPCALGTRPADVAALAGGGDAHASWLPHTRPRLDALRASAAALAQRGLGRRRRLYGGRRWRGRDVPARHRPVGAADGGAVATSRGAARSQGAASRPFRSTVGCTRRGR